MKQLTTDTGRRDWDDLDIDVEALIAELHDTVEGEVRFDRGSRALYATDASNYRHVPIGVVLPKTINDVVATHAACHRYAAPVLARGSGTSLSGETVNVAVVMDFSKYLHGILDIDPDNKLARVEPGVVHDQLSEQTLKHHLVFAPDPSTHAYCTVGGNVGNNSCGVHSVQAQGLGEGPRTSDNVEEMEVLTYDGYRMRVGPTSPEELEKIIAAGGRRGKIYSDLAQLAEDYAEMIRERFPDIPRRVSGYNLDELLPENGFNVARALVGTEGTCVTVLNATLKLVHDPPVRTLAVVGYTDIFEAGNHIPR
ncbi:MAG: FAD-binding oxidoreductase, partial [Actinobacteria bacterium]|nr:FAD-binding oxidoreductase [Actinomycetota bacterium]